MPLCAAPRSLSSHPVIFDIGVSGCQRTSWVCSCRGWLAGQFAVGTFFVVAEVARQRRSGTMRGKWWMTYQIWVYSSPSGVLRVAPGCVCHHLCIWCLWHQFGHSWLLDTMFSDERGAEIMEDRRGADIGGCWALVATIVLIMLGCVKQGLQE